jgi:D-alanyl-D-alanine carboxypeptidase
MMNRKSTIFFVSVLLLSMSLSARADKVDDYIKAEIAKRHIAGASMAVIRNGKVIASRGYGMANIERGIRVKPDTMFQIASTTKPFTAMSVMMLVEEGKISLDEKAIKYLPWIPAIYSDVTVRQLLSHTSGINRDVRTANVDNFSIDEFKKRFAVAPMSFKPGERWEYSNNGYILLGLIIEAVSAKPFGEFLAQSITKPLGMKNTKYNEPPDEKIKNRAVGYDWLENSFRRSPHFFGGYTGGAIISSATDLAKWVRALDSEKLLKKSSLEQMWTPVKLGNGQPLIFEFRGDQSGYGFGWFITSYKGRKLLTHGGTVSGFSSQIMRFVEDDNLTIIVLTNSKSGEDRIGYAEVLARGIADIYFSDQSEKKL